jgi:hypothetical protein
MVEGKLMELVMLIYLQPLHMLQLMHQFLYMGFLQLKVPIEVLHN